MYVYGVSRIILYAVGNWLCQTIERHRFMAKMWTHRPKKMRIFAMISFTIYSPLLSLSINPRCGFVRHFSSPMCSAHNGLTIYEEFQPYNLCGITIIMKYAWNNLLLKRIIKKSGDDQVVKLIFFLFSSLAGNNFSCCRWQNDDIIFWRWC